MSEQKTPKPRIAVFSLTSCEGCSLQILNCEDEILDLLTHVDIVNFREAIDERSEDYDIAFVDGAVSTRSDAEEARHIRSQAKVLVAIGACACTGGLNVLKNYQDPQQVRERVYGTDSEWLDTIEAQPLDAAAKVDIKLPGCPMSKEEFLHLLECADRSIELPPTASHDDAYEAAGQYVLDHCDVLIAIWDGQIRGTRNMIKQAEERGLSVYLPRVEIGE